MRRRAITFAGAAAALGTGCATLVDEQPPPELTLRLSPASLGRDLAQSQHLRVHIGEREIVLDALLEADAGSLRLALLAFERPLARLMWDGRTLTQQSASGWPDAVSAERILSDLTLTLWPADAVAAALPRGWSLATDSDTRELRWRSQTVLRVRYHGEQRFEIEHLVRGYRIEIESRAIRD